MSGGIAGLVLAGGQGRRLGNRDKALVDLCGRPLLAHVFERLSPQCVAMVISANGDPARFADWPAPVVADALPEPMGPLAGVLAGLDWLAAAHPTLSAMVSVSVDTPFLPMDLVARLSDAWRHAGAEAASAVSGGRRHPVVALWPLAMRGAVRQALAGDAGRSVDRLLRAHRCTDVSWPSEPTDPFFNINHPQDLERARNLLRRDDPGR